MWMVTAVCIGTHFQYEMFNVSQRHSEILNQTVHTTIQQQFNIFRVIPDNLIGSAHLHYAHFDLNVMCSSIVPPDLFNRALQGKPIVSVSAVCLCGYTLSCYCIDNNAYLKSDFISSLRRSVPLCSKQYFYELSTFFQYEIQT